MSYINVQIDRAHQIASEKYDALKEAEAKFWEAKAEDYRKRLENAFQAVKEHGYVDLHYDSEVLTLIQKPDTVGEGETK